MAGPNSSETTTHWRMEAACRDTDPDLFYPVGTTGSAIEQIAHAKSICAQCISQVACLEYALNAKEQYGIWGGTTEEERRQILKDRAQSDVG